MQSISRGSTPLLTFTTPYERDLITRGFITFKQHSKIALDIPVDDYRVTIKDNAIELRLTQEDTLKLVSEPSVYTVEIQVRLILGADTAVTSNIFTASVEEILKDGVI